MAKAIGPQNAQYDQEERAERVYHEGGGLEHQFQYLAEEVADALLRMLYIPRSDVHPRHRHHVAGDQPSSSSCLSNSSFDTR